MTVVSTGATRASDASQSTAEGPISAFSTLTQLPVGCGDQPGARCFELSANVLEKLRGGA